MSSQWEQHWDDNAQAHFYHHPTTGETTWEMPQEVAASQQGGGGEEDEWDHHWSEEHQSYFKVHKTLGHSVWADEGPPAEAAGAAAAGGETQAYAHESELLPTVPVQAHGGGNMYSSLPAVPEEAKGGGEGGEGGGENVDAATAEEDSSAALPTQTTTGMSELPEPHKISTEKEESEPEMVITAAERAAIAEANRTPINIGFGTGRGEVNPSHHYLPPEVEFRQRGGSAKSLAASASVPTASLGSSRFMNDAELSLTGRLKLVVDATVVSAGGSAQREKIAAEASGNTVGGVDHPLLYHRLTNLHGHTDRVTSLVLTSENVISGSLDKTLKVWSLATGSLVRTMEGHSKGITALELCSTNRNVADPELVVSGSGDYALKIWRHRTGELVRTIKAHGDGISALAAEGDIAVSGSFDATAKVWNLSTGKATKTFKTHFGAISAVALKGTVAASASREGRVCVWDRTTGEVTAQLDEEDSSYVTSLLLGRGVIFAGYFDGAMRVWNVADLQYLRACEGHSENVTRICGVQHPLRGEEGATGTDSTDGLVVASVSTDGTVILWEAETCNVLDRVAPAAAECEAHALAARNNAIAVAGDDGVIRMYCRDHLSTGAARTEQPPHLLRQLLGHTGTVSSLALEGDVLVSGSHDKSVRIWDVITGENRHTLTSHASKVSTVDISDGLVVSGDMSKTVCLHRLSRPTEEAPDGEAVEHVKPFVAHDGPILGVAMEGEAIATCARDMSMRVWNKEDAKAMFMVEELRIITAIAMNGDVIVTGSQNFTVKVWSRQADDKILERHHGLLTPKLLMTLDAPAHGVGSVAGHIGAISAVAVNDRYVVSGSLDKTVKVWNLDTGKLMYSLDDHTTAISTVALVGELVLSTAFDPDSTIKIWHCATGKRLRTLETRHQSGVTAMAAASRGGAPDDICIVTASSDRTINVYRYNVLTELPRAVVECTTRYGAFEEVSASILFAGLRGLEVALDWLMRTDAETGASFFHTHIMPNSHAAPLAAMLANVLGHELLRYVDPVGGKAVYEVGHTLTRRAMDEETLLGGRYRITGGATSDRNVSENNVVYFADDTAACDTYGGWFDERTTKSDDGGGSGDGMAKDVFLDLRGFKAICKEYDIIRRSIGFGATYMHEIEEALEDEEIVRHFMHCKEASSGGVDEEGGEVARDVGKVRRSAFITFCTTMLGTTNRVALKFMADEASFEREKSSRAAGQLDPHLVMPIRATYSNKRKAKPAGDEAATNNEEIEDHAQRFISWWQFDPRFSGYEYLIVMEAGNRNLEQIIACEGTDFRQSTILLQQVAKSLGEVHTKDLVHCDAKPKNCVRLASGRVVLVDLDAMLPRGHFFGERDLSSGFVPPEALREETGEHGGEIFTVRSFEFDGPSDGPTDAMRVNRRTKEFISDDLLLQAEPTLDVWALGIIAHMLICQGAHPYASIDREDSIRSADLRRLAKWDIAAVLKMADHMSRSLRIADNRASEDSIDLDRFAAIDFVAWCLQPDPAIRPSSASKVLDHRFLNLRPLKAEVKAQPLLQTASKIYRMKMCRPMIHLAAAMGDVNLLESLLTEKLVSPNLRDGLLHETPLHRAMKENKIKAVHRLLQAPEILPDARDAAGDTPLLGFLKYTDEYWADPNHSFGGAGEMSSERASFKEIVSLLLTRADLHEHDVAGRSGFELLAGSAIPEVRSLIQTLPPQDAQKSMEFAEAAKVKALAAQNIHIVDETIEQLRAENDELKGLNEIAKHAQRVYEERIAELEAKVKQTAVQLQRTHSATVDILAAKTEREHPSKLKGAALIGARLRVEGFAEPGTVYRFEKSINPNKNSTHFIKFDDDKVSFEDREEVPVVLVRTKHGRTIGTRYILLSDENIC